MIGGVVLKDLVKIIRTKANMNQEQFASALGTTAVSINRWENGKSVPNQMAQTNLYQFCKTQKIDVADIVTKMLRYEHTDGRNPYAYKLVFRTEKRLCLYTKSAKIKSAKKMPSGTSD